MSTATIHHIAHDKHRRGGGLRTTTGDPLAMPDAEVKLDRLQETVAAGFTDLAVRMATISEQVTHTARATDDHEARLRRVEERADLTAQLHDLALRVEVLEKRHPGITPWQLWTASGSAVAMAGVLVAIIDRLIH